MDGDTAADGFEPRRLWRPSGIHEEYGIALNEIYRAIHEGRLKACRPAGTSRGYWVTQESLDSWLRTARMIRVN